MQFPVLRTDIGHVEVGAQQELPKNMENLIEIPMNSLVWSRFKIFGNFGEVQARPARSPGWVGAASEAILGGKGHGPVYCEVITRRPAL